MFDRNKNKNKIQLRLGDILVLYNTVQMPHDLQPKIVFPESNYASKQTMGSAQKANDSKYASNQTRSGH